jgi:hypothetical protein
MTIVNPKTRIKRLAWEPLPNRENHALDARVLARVAAGGPAAGSGGGAELGGEQGTAPTPDIPPPASARPGSYWSSSRPRPGGGRPGGAAECRCVASAVAAVAALTPR